MTYDLALTGKAVFVNGRVLLRRRPAVTAGPWSGGMLREVQE